MVDPYAKVIADSITDDGHRLTTVEVGGWRPVLAEQNTHRVFSRNSASSRAIPITKNLAQFADNQMLPASWRAEQKGMQGGAELVGDDLEEAKELWRKISDGIYQNIDAYIQSHPEPSTRLHKSLLNRWIEPGLMQVQIISGTDWEGYFWQRCHEAADDNIRLMAEAIRDARENSTPRLLQDGEWHLPYFGPENGGHAEDWEDLARYGRENSLFALGDSMYPWAKRVSAGRCARVSYMNQNGQRDIGDDLSLFDRLATRDETGTQPPHASPLEHVATPWNGNVDYVEMPNGNVMGPLPRLGNFTGWWQMRHEELSF